MKKKFLCFAAAASLVLSFVACGGSDDNDDTPSTPQQVVFTQPVYADQAASYVLKNPLQSEGFSLTAINITESGKAIIETTESNGSKHYSSYNVTINGDEYQMKNKAGKSVGVMKKVTTRAASVSITLTVVIELSKLGTVEFKSDDPLEVQTVISTIAAGVNTDNIARTWKVKQMKMTLEGDVNASIIENSGNLAVLAAEAQVRGAGLTEKEMAEFDKILYGLTLDKTGLFSLEYGDGSSEACSWTWTNSNQDQLKLSLRDSEFGNKFFGENSTIDVKFFPGGGCQLFLVTNIMGNKNYKATLNIAMEQ